MTRVQVEIAAAIFFLGGATSSEHSARKTGHVDGGKYRGETMVSSTIRGMPCSSKKERTHRGSLTYVPSIHHVLVISIASRFGDAWISTSLTKITFIRLGDSLVYHNYKIVMWIHITVTPKSGEIDPRILVQVGWKSKAINRSRFGLHNPKTESRFSLENHTEGANNVLLVKIEGPVWYTMYHQLPSCNWG